MSASFVMKNAQVYNTETRTFGYGCIRVENGRITAVAPHIPAGTLPIIDAEGMYVTPGLVDVHTHGRIGYDFDSASADEMRQMRASYMADGTTTVMATIASAPMERIEAAIDHIKEAGFDGVHLEGRYLNVKRRGAHRPDLLAPLDKNELEGLLNRMHPLTIHITCAAELDGGREFVETALAHGATVSLGHSDASYEQACDAFEWGVTATTHTFNAMTPIQHRAPGIITAAMNDDSIYCEMIADGFHLHPAIVNLLYRAKRPYRLTLITDSMSATRCCDGEYGIAGEKVFVVNGKAVNEEGNIAGSTITLYDAVLNLMKFAHVSFAEALPYATLMPAQMVGLDATVGSIAVGKRADLLLVNPENYEIKAVYANGEAVVR